MPYKSKKQWRWAFANKKSFAHKWGKESRGTYKSLPLRKRSKKK